MSSQKELTLERGSEDWKKFRRLVTKSVPGKHSALYALNERVLGKADLVPMTYRAHMGMCLFAEGATGIPEIDNARIKMILVPRGVGKSSLVTKALPILRICQDRNQAVGIANEKADLASTFLGDIKSEFEQNMLLQSLFPEVIPDDFRKTTWAADKIIVNRDKANPTSPSILATGVGGTVTGVHMDMWICDDLLSQNAAENAYRGSFTEIEATNRWIKRIQPLLKSPKRDPILFIGTRWWEGDTYEFIEEFFGHDEPKRRFMLNLSLPAQTIQWDYDSDGEPEKTDRGPEKQSIPLYRRGEIAVFKFPAIDSSGRPIFPERYDIDELQQMQQEDPVFYAGQYLLEPTAGAASTFDTEWLKYYEWEGSMLRYRDDRGDPVHVPVRDLAILISVDPAFSKKHSAARTAVPVVGTDGDRLFLLEDFAERMDDEDAIAQQVLAFYLRYSSLGAPPTKIFVETIVAQVAVANAIRRAFRDAGLDAEPLLEEIKSHGKQKKTMRIFGLQHYFKNGLVYIQKRHSKFIQEYASFPRGNLRDVLDAMSFQTPEWERIFLMGRVGQGPTNQVERMQAEQSALQRVKDAWGRRRYRR